MIVWLTWNSQYLNIFSPNTHSIFLLFCIFVFKEWIGTKAFLVLYTLTFIFPYSFSQFSLTVVNYHYGFKFLVLKKSCLDIEVGIDGSRESEDKFTFWFHIILEVNHLISLGLIFFIFLQLHI